jgi:lipoprotein-anchoring transpeptidase ErfK/SrfK
MKGRGVSTMRTTSLIWLCLLATASGSVAKSAEFEIIGAMGGSEDYAMLPQSSDPIDYGVDASDSRLAVQTIPFNRDLPVGSILVKTSERKLYYVLPNKQALRYPVGVGRDGFTWSGRNQISRKAEWPTWRPPQVMIDRESRRGHFLPEEMQGGPENPLGARALYIGSTEFRIHGTTQPWSIGHAVSSGCIRMLNQHVEDLYERVAVGATIVVER